jgi:DNA-binding NtrC family response regulator
MPGGLSGIQLAETLTNSRPDMKVLLMSAFNCEESIFNSGWLFISKPFRPAALVSKIEEALGQQLHPNSGNSGAAGQTAA